MVIQAIGSFGIRGIDKKGSAFAADEFSNEFKAVRVREFKFLLKGRNRLDSRAEGLWVPSRPESVSVLPLADETRTYCNNSAPGCPITDNASEGSAARGDGRACKHFLNLLAADAE